MERSNTDHTDCPNCGRPAAAGHTCSPQQEAAHRAEARASGRASALIGKSLGPNYRIVEPIGSGAMGMVYVVEHNTLRKRFAAKLLTADLARHPEAIARFEMEAHAASQLDHDNIVSVIDFGRTDDGWVFIIMELLRGKTLQARMDQGPPSIDEIVSVVLQVCAALAAAHAAGIVHRDMKPDNVFLTQRPGGRPVVKVLDFGISKAREGQLRDGRITKQGQLLGSPEYMSPEASRGDEVNTRADIYAVGVMLYELMCGEVPFRNENYLKTLQMHATQLPRPPRQLVPGLPLAVERLILRALEKDPRNRHPSIEELEAELIAALPDVAQRALSSTPSAPSGHWLPSASHPMLLVNGPGAGLAEGSGTSHAPGQADTMLVNRRRGRRGILVTLWGGAAVAAAAAAIVMLVRRFEAADQPGIPPVAAQPAAGLRPVAAGPGDIEPTEPAPVEPETASASPEARPAEILLRIESSPPGASATLEGKLLGRTPLEARVPASDGGGELELELQGYRSITKTVSLDRDRDVQVSLRESRRSSSGSRKGGGGGGRSGGRSSSRSSSRSNGDSDERANGRPPPTSTSKKDVDPPTMRAPTWTLVVTFTLGSLSIAARPQPALADSSADEADARFHRGNQLFKSGRFDEALVEFFASNRLAHNRNVIFNIARSYEALARYEEAYRYYAEYISEEPNKDERSAAIRRLKEIEPRVALLRIESNPPGATIYLERKDLGGRGETPLLLAVPPGRHKVLIDARGYKQEVVTTEAVRGRSTEVGASLELIVGQLRIASRPRAAVYIDRAAGTAAPPVARTTPATLKLPPGRHTVELEATGYRVVRSDVIIRAGAETKLDLTLEERAAPSGTVVLASETPGALVMVGGVERGFTPAVLNLAVGTHDIEVRGDGYRVWRRNVTVAKDGRAFYEVELVEEEPEVTGATRVQQTLSQAPASVSVVSRDEIWSLGYQTLTDAVRSVRGVYTSDDKNYEAIGVRGFSRPGDLTNRLLLTRDGHAMNDVAFGSAAVGRDFAADLDDVSRIEVVRGPGSAFYGPSAFFGVIQVVSEEPGYGRPVRAGGSLASDGGAVAFARGTAGSGIAAVSVYASVYESSGDELHFDEFEDTPAAGDVRDGDGEDAQRGGLRARVGEFSLDASLARRRKDVPTAPYETLFGEASQTTDRRGYAEARWDHRRGPFGITARAAYDHQRYDGEYPYEDDDIGLYQFTDEGGGDWMTGEVRLSLEGFSQKLTLGGEVADHSVSHGYYDSSTGTRFNDDRPFVNGSVYGAEEVSLFGDVLRVSAGARLDWFGEQSDTSVSPRLGVIVRPYEDGYTKFIAGRAFRSPSPYELYYFDGGITQVQALRLDPETIWTGEAEHTHSLGPRSFLIGSVFASQISDIINLGPSPDDQMEEVLVFQNSAEDVRAIGGELEARYAYKTGAWWSAAASYTWLDSDDEAVEVNSAAAVGSLRGFLPLVGDRLGLASELIYNSPRPRRDGEDTAAVVLGRLFLSGRLRSAGLLYRAGVTNLLDWDWSVPVGEELLPQQIDQPARAFQAQLIYEMD